MATPPPKAPGGRRDSAAATAALLVEIGVEELPPRGLEQLGAAFAARLTAELESAGLLAAPDYRAFATPRRLAALFSSVLRRQPAQTIIRQGPPVAAAYDARNQPTAAARGFAKSCGVALNKLTVMETSNGARLAYRATRAGKKLDAILNAALQKVTRAMPAPKRMRWGAGAAEFIRPAHWLTALHGRDTVAAKVLELTADRFTYGHRFHSKKLRLPNAELYEKFLWERGLVIADYDKRRTEITRQITRLTRSGDARAVVSEELLDEVTGLVEWPQAFRGRFDPRFLKLPREVIISVLHKHQKYFHLVDRHNKLRPEFIAVSNIKLPRAAGRPSPVQIGNERVLRARLADAEFFYNEDLKTPLPARAEQLNGILFHHKLGTLQEKTKRVVQLATHIAGQINAHMETAARAAELCKADLTTELVAEFPELQGVVGRHYANKTGEGAAVANAIEQHYWPRFAGDRIPQTRAAMSVALADRADSLVGFFTAGEIPGGDKDPFALRRAAAGIARVIIEKKLPLNVYELLAASAKIYGPAAHAKVVDVEKFFYERLPGYYLPLGYGAAAIAAVQATRPPTLANFHRRLAALHNFLRRHAAAAATLAAAHKRIAGVLKRAAANTTVNEQLFRHPAEHHLAKSLRDLELQTRDDFARHRYARGLQKLARLKQPIDEFFEHVMVLDEDANLRANRLALLNRARQLFLQVADISKLADGASAAKRKNSNV